LFLFFSEIIFYQTQNYCLNITFLGGKVDFVVG
jgi:hypothetical protein